ncbi:unnamed protein product [Paramecium primaurelia]|uniref:Uncharacterized protein n=1 Tax=Paramecium primaurelia TaxID=5886 RepID=A0A8S1KAG3_PARPR|nr:unnamed protein product [Paramecium primaurelia]
MTLDNLREPVKVYDNYRDILRDSPDSLKREEFNFQTKIFDDIMQDDECRQYVLAFDGQGSYGVFYAYLKLKDQEFRNIIWLAEMISRKLAKNHPGWKKQQFHLIIQDKEDQNILSIFIIYYGLFDTKIDIQYF